METPVGYEAPLTNREEIEAYLWSLNLHKHLKRRPLTWFVRTAKADFSWEKLREIGLALVKDQHISMTTEQLCFLHGRYASTPNMEELLKNWGSEAIFRNLTEYVSNKMLWYTGEVVADWIVGVGETYLQISMSRFRSLSLVNTDLTRILGGMSDLEVVEFYRFVVQCKHDFRQQAIIEEMEYQAGWDFFINWLGGVDQLPDLSGNTMPEKTMVEIILQGQECS